MSKPSLMCRIFGHKWMSEWIPQKYVHTISGIATESTRDIYKACCRCGESNPNYEGKDK